MKIVVQRVSKASVLIDNNQKRSIEKGLLVFIGFTHNDRGEQLPLLIDKIINMRIFPDQENKMNLSTIDIRGEILLISQFTLYGDARKGRRPSFTEAAKPDYAKTLYDLSIDLLKQTGLKIETGEFAADMKVELINDGPVTIILEV